MEITNEVHWKNEDLIVPGYLLEYFIIAHKEFSKDQDNLKNFRVLFFEDPTEIKITFAPNRAPDEKKRLGGRTSLGREVSYIISKENKIIIRWHYSK